MLVLVLVLYCVVLSWVRACVDAGVVFSCVALRYVVLYLVLVGLCCGFS